MATEPGIRFAETAINVLQEIAMISMSRKDHVDDHPVPNNSHQKH